MMKLILAILVIVSGFYVLSQVSINVHATPIECSTDTECSEMYPERSTRLFQ